MTVYIFASLKPKIEHRIRVELALKALVSATRMEPGNISYDLFSVKEGDGELCLIESYMDMAAFEAHKASKHYHDYRKTVTHWLLEAPTVKVLQPMDVLTQKAVDKL